MSNELVFPKPYLINKKIFMIGSAEIAHMFLKENILSKFFLTYIHKPYGRDTYLDLSFFKNWPKEKLFQNLFILFIIFKI